MSEPSARAVMINGSLVGDGAADVALDDGLVRGDGVFEGMRLYERAPRTFAGHLERLERSAHNVDLAIDTDLLRAEMATFAAAVSEPNCGVRLMLTRGGHRIWREEPIPTFPAGLRLRPAPHRVSPLLIGAKTLSYAPNMQAQRQAKASGCDEALLVRADDQAILEGPVAAFGWVEGETLVFPPLDDGVLDSLTRRIAVAAVPTTTRTTRLAELARADGAILMSTVIEAQPVAEVLDIARFDAAAPVVTEMCAAITAAARAATEPVGA